MSHFTETIQHLILRPMTENYGSKWLVSPPLLLSERQTAQLNSTELVCSSHFGPGGCHKSLLAPCSKLSPTNQSAARRTCTTKFAISYCMFLWLDGASLLRALEVMNTHFGDSGGSGGGVCKCTFNTAEFPNKTTVEYHAFNNKYFAFRLFPPHCTPFGHFPSSSSSPVVPSRVHGGWGRGCVFNETCLRTWNRAFGSDHSSRADKKQIHAGANRRRRSTDDDGHSWQ